MMQKETTFGVCLISQEWPLTKFRQIYFAVFTEDCLSDSRWQVASLKDELANGGLPVLHCRQEIRDARMPRPAAKVKPDASPVSAAVMPKDPSLAELVDQVRQNLDLVASMHASQTSSCSSAEKAMVSLKIGGQKQDEKDKENVGELLQLLEVTGEKTVQPSGPAGHCLQELLDELAAAAETQRGVAEPRPESVLSGVGSEDFMVITPSSDSCVHFSIGDFEAAVSELDSEDTVRNRSINTKSIKFIIFSSQ